jgi:hypothetical protein
MDRDSRRMRGERPFVFSNMKTGEGLAEIIAFIWTARAAAVRCCSPAAARKRRHRPNRHAGTDTRPRRDRRLTRCAELLGRSALALRDGARFSHSRQDHRPPGRYRRGGQGRPGAGQARSGDSALSATAAAAQLELAAADLQRFAICGRRTSSARRRSTARKPPSGSAGAGRTGAQPVRLYRSARRSGRRRRPDLGEVGQVVAAGQTVMRLARADTLEVAISIPEARMPGARALGTAEVSLWADAGRYRERCASCRRWPTR